MKTLTCNELEIVTGGGTTTGTSGGTSGTSAPTSDPMSTSIGDAWSRGDYSGIACNVGMEAIGTPQVQADIACGTDWSGDNPLDPINSDRAGDIVQHNLDVDQVTDAAQQ